MPEKVQKGFNPVSRPEAKCWGETRPALSSPGKAGLFFLPDGWFPRKKGSAPLFWGGMPWEKEGSSKRSLSTA